VDANLAFEASLLSRFKSVGKIHPDILGDVLSKVPLSEIFLILPFAARLSAILPKMTLSVDYLALKL
jgi:hypothetical protein